MTENKQRTSANQVIVSSRHPYLTDTPVRPGMRSPGGSGSSSRSRTPHAPSIHMEPGLQALLVAESQASTLIVAARQKRNQLLRQAKQESQAEIEAFRREREIQYQIKLHEAIQLERFQAKLAVDQHDLLENMEINVVQKRESLVNFIVHCVIDQIPVRQFH